MLEIAGFRLALPDYKNFPTIAFQLRLNSRISSFIPFEFELPEVLLRFRNDLTVFAPMPMPEASMNKYNFAQARKYQIRVSSKVTNM
jgi:hypothetical protein